MKKVRIAVGPHLSDLTVEIWFAEVKLRMRASQGVSVLTTFPSQAAAEDGSNQLFLKDFDMCSIQYTFMLIHKHVRVWYPSRDLSRFRVAQTKGDTMQ